MSNYAQQLHNTIMSQSYLSIPQERKSHIVHTMKDGAAYFQHNNNNNSARTSVLVQGSNIQQPPVASPAFQRMLRVSDLSNLSGNNLYHNENVRLTPDTQENSQIFYQSTYGGHDQQPMTPMHNFMMNRQLNIDDDELIEIRPDMMNTNMGINYDQQMGMYRDNSRDSTGSFYVDQNFIENNQSLENVKDSTNNNSPTNNIKKLQDHIPQSAKTSGQKKEIYIEEPQQDITQMQNETGILRYSLANQTTFIQRQRRPQMQGLELVEGSFVEIDEDSLFAMQNEIIEEIIMRKDPNFLIQNLNQKQHMKKASMKTSPQRISKIEPRIEKISSDDREEQIYLESEQADSNNITPINRQQQQLQNHIKHPSMQTDTDKSLTMYDAFLSVSGVLSSNPDFGNTYRNFDDDTTNLMRPIIEEDEEENLLSSQTNGSQQNINFKQTMSYNSNRQQNKPVMFDKHHGEESFEEQSINNDEEEEDDYRTEETLENDDQIVSKANQTAILTKKSTIPKSNSSKSNPRTEESPNIQQDEEQKVKYSDQDKIIIVSRSASFMNEDQAKFIQNESLEQDDFGNQFTLDNDIQSNSMVQIFNKNLQNAEVRVSRTKTVQIYRDSNLQDTQRGIREPAKYNPDYSLMQMEELNKSVVFKLRPSNYVKKTKKQAKIPKELPKKPSGTDDYQDNDDVDDDNKLNVYLSKPATALKKEYISPVQVTTKFEDDPVPLNKQVLKVGSRNLKPENVVTKSMTITQSFTDLFQSTANLLNPRKKRISLGDIQGDGQFSLYHLLKLNSSKQNQKMRSQHYYEEFQMIGIDQESLDSVEDQINRLVPKNLFNYPLQLKEDLILNERARVVKDFCFPNGVLAIKLNYNAEEEFQNDPEVNEIIQDILYRQKNYRENTFIFTLDANEEVGESGDNYMHCICVTFNELMRRQSDQQLFLVQKAYCFMFQNNYFPLHLEVLNGLLQSIKLERFKQPTDFYESGHLQILREIESALSVPINNNLGEIKYTFPSNYEDSRRLDCMWFCPTIFSLFHIEDFFRILTAVLLERSLIFVSDNLAILTSVVLGFKSLIKPFQWCYALIPVLPSPLIDILDTPQPILCGITRHDYTNISLSEDEMQTKTWILLDEEQIQVNWGEYDSDLSMKSKKQQNLMKWCKVLIKDTEQYFAKFYSNNIQSFDPQKRSVQGRLSDYYDNKPNSITRQTLAPIEEYNNSVVLAPNDQQKVACRNIFNKIQETLDSRILMNIPGTPVFKNKTNHSLNMEVDINQMSEQVLSNAKNKDELEFLKEFIKTQMFTTLVEDFFNKTSFLETAQSLQNLLSPHSIEK
eukprot:403348413